MFISEEFLSRKPCKRRLELRKGAGQVELPPSRSVLAVIPCSECVPRRSRSITGQAEMKMRPKEGALPRDSLRVERKRLHAAGIQSGRSQLNPPHNLGRLSESTRHRSDQLCKKCLTILPGVQRARFLGSTCSSRCRHTGGSASRRARWMSAGAARLQDSGFSRNKTAAAAWAKSSTACLSAAIRQWISE